MAAVLLSLSLVACESNPVGKTTAAPVTLRLATRPVLSNAIIHMGVVEGCFSDQGITLETVELKGSSETLAALAAGDVDVGTPSISSALFNAVAAGSGMRMVLPLTTHVEQPCTTVALMARKEDVDSGRFADPGSWKGARFLVTEGGLQGLNGYYISRALEQSGLTLDDLRYEKAEAAVHEEALRAGKADISVALEPWITRMQASGEISVLTPLEPYASGMQASSIVYSERMMENEAVAQRFAIAYMQALRQYAQGPTESNVRSVSEFTGLDPDLVARMCWSYAPVDGKIDTASLGDFQHWLVQEGMIDRVLEPDAYVDTRYAEEAVRILDRNAK